MPPILSKSSERCVLWFLPLSFYKKETNKNIVPKISAPNKLPINGSLKSSSECCGWKINGLSSKFVGILWTFYAFLLLSPPVRVFIQFFSSHEQYLDLPDVSQRHENFSEKRGKSRLWWNLGYIVLDMIGFLCPHACFCPKTQCHSQYSCNWSRQKNLWAQILAPFLINCVVFSKIYHL